MRKLARPVQKVNADVVGLDVHQRQITFTHLDPHGEEVEVGQVGCSEADVLALLDRLPRPLHVAFEAGGSTFWLYDVLVKALGKGFVHVAQPRKIPAIAILKAPGIEVLEEEEGEGGGGGASVELLWRFGMSYERALGRSWFLGAGRSVDAVTSDKVAVLVAFKLTKYF